LYEKSTVISFLLFVTIFHNALRFLHEKDIYILEGKIVRSALIFTNIVVG